MIDFHNHVLPNIDDGPKHIEESLSMLKSAYHQGITDVVQTVHFQHPKMIDKIINESILEEKLNVLVEELRKNKIRIKVHLASEVFYLPNLIEIANIPFVTFNNKYMLVEFSSVIFPKNFEEQFFKLQNSGINPIIAHPERYRYVKNDVSLIERWIELGYILQLDAGSIIGSFGKKIQEVSFNIIEKYGFHLIGSDAHNNKKRNFCLKDAYSLLEIKYKKEFVNQLKNNAELLLLGEQLSLSQVKQKNSLISRFKTKFMK